MLMNIDIIINDINNTLIYHKATYQRTVEGNTVFIQVFG